MKKYEILIILPGTIAENELPAATDRIQKVVEESGAKVKEVQSMGKMRLAYPMNNVRYGYFFNFLVECDGEATKTINAKLLIEEQVLRFVIRSFVPPEKKKGKEIPAEAVVSQKVQDPEPHTAVVDAPQVKEEEKSQAPEAKEDLDKKLDELLNADLKIDI